MSAIATIDPEQELADRLAEFRWDPLACALYSFPWGEGELGKLPGPRQFQRKFLGELRDHLQNPNTRHKVFRKAVSSGHGIGKSALIGMVLQWALSTCLDCKVLVTANTQKQMETKTQPEIAKWFRLAINDGWFDVKISSIKINDAEHSDTWRTDFVSWSEDNPQAFAGAHNYGKRLVIIFDEASEISDSIYKTVEGALTDQDTEIIWLLFSQCTRSEGAFFEATFGDQRHRWRPEAIDSRDIEGINVEEINESIVIYGDDSDHVRVRYKGLFPQAGGGQFIEWDLIREAQIREARSLSDDPLVAGFDAAWGGADDNVIRFRCGFDGRSIPPVKVKGSFTRDPAVMTQRIANILTTTYQVNGVPKKVAMMFFDSAGIAAPIESRLRDLGHKNIMVVNFGADSIEPRCVFMRDLIWTRMKDWLPNGAIDKDPGFAADLKKPILISDPKQRIKLEPKELMKKRLAKLGLDSTSPDDGDAFALTFAHKVLPPKKQDLGPPPRVGVWS